MTYISDSYEGLGLENRLLVCKGKRRVSVNKNENNYGMKKNKKAGCRGKLKFSCVELLRLMI